MDAIPVYRVFAGTRCETEVWMSEHAASQIEKECDDKPAIFMKKLKMLGEGGFRNYEGEKNSHIRHEGNGVYRVRHKESSWFRLLGFYVDDSRKCFIALDAVRKKNGDTYTAKHRAIMTTIAEIKAKGQWRMR